MARKCRMPAATSSFGYCDWNGKLSVVTNASGFMVEYENDVMDRVTNISWKTTLEDKGQNLLIHQH